MSWLSRGDFGTDPFICDVLGIAPDALTAADADDNPLVEAEPEAAQAPRRPEPGPCLNGLASVLLPLDDD